MRIGFVLLLLAASVGCADPVNLRVFSGEHSSWELGEVKDCERISHTLTTTPSQSFDTRELLLCGVSYEWDWKRMKADDKDLIAVTATSFAITFHGNDSPNSWKCRRSPEGIDCQH